MKKIKLNSFNIFYCVIGFVLPILGISFVHNFNYLVISASAFIIAITLIYIYVNSKEHISDLIIMPDEVVMIYRKFNIKCNAISIDIKGIKSVEINITKEVSNSNVVNTFPYKIDVHFRGDSLYKSFSVQKGSYDIVFQIYDMLKDMIGSININANGSHSHIIQSDIDNYIKGGKRLSVVSRFLLPQNKRGIIEIYVGIIITLFFFAFILYMFINYVSGRV